MLGVRYSLDGAFLATAFEGPAPNSAAVTFSRDSTLIATASRGCGPSTAAGPALRKCAIWRAKSC